MNNYIKNTLLKNLIGILVLIILFGGTLVLVVKDDYFKDITNSCRVLVSDQLNDISLGSEDEKEAYPYTIVALDGKVIKSTEKEPEDQIALNNLSLDNWQSVDEDGIVRYSTPLIVEEKIESLVIFSIPKADIVNLRSDKNFRAIFSLAALVFFSGIMFLLYRIYKVVNKDILKPIDEMHKSATEILKGNYLERVSYDYPGEIGQFSHDFESMRDGLVASSENERKLKTAEKELLACISHDLKTPLANISGYCEGIIDGVVKEDQDVKRYVGIILKKARVLTKLLDDILEFSKAEINQMSIKKQETYSEEFFTGLLEEASMDVVSSGRKFILQGEIPNLLINLDRDKVAQAINNIISNAVKYTTRSGIITIAFERISEGLRISIKDNGVGIAAEELPLVFNKFYRGEKHRNQNIPGSGLGLSIAKYIAEAHNGTIEMLSSKDKGTEVIIKIRNISNDKN